MKILYPDIRISGFYIRISGFYIRNLFVSDTTSWKIPYFKIMLVTLMALEARISTRSLPLTEKFRVFFRKRAIKELIAVIVAIRNWEIFQEVVSETNKFRIQNPDIRIQNPDIRISGYRIRIQNFHKLFQFKKSHSYQTGLPLSADCFQFLGRKLRNLLPPTLPDICGMNETSLPGKILLQKPLVFKNSLAIHSQ